MCSLCLASSLCILLYQPQLLKIQQDAKHEPKCTGAHVSFIRKGWQHQKVMSPQWVVRLVMQLINKGGGQSPYSVNNWKQKCDRLHFGKCTWQDIYQALLHSGQILEQIHFSEKHSLFWNGSFHQDLLVFLCNIHHYLTLYDSVTGLIGFPHCEANLIRAQTSCFI